MLSSAIKNAVRDVADFPKEGIIFKDITPILKDAALCTSVVEAMFEQLQHIQVDVIAGIESRGFLFGLMLANRMKVPFVPVRKKGKLPAETIAEACDLEYGSAVLELHTDAILPGQKVLIHDDLLATGGTVRAATRLVQRLQGEIAAYSFVISLDFLNGKEELKKVCPHILSLASY